MGCGCNKNKASFDVVAREGGAVIASGQRTLTAAQRAGEESGQAYTIRAGTTDKASA